ncbi:Clp protease N-terminal domain-containing protein [Nonomuraea sp. SBT364]|uniref:Clp protease N-terminal domain-containing protein n=1 Tax=Nonomuraea sp. SBT364 TaxID=1580530 RepID=UPI00066A42CD|nr:Clp protease N-terminal domain-containing protein [Nonomuraea sp. SBT364]
MSQFDAYLHEVLERAGHEAARDASATIEAHHLLLAVAAGHEPALTSAGLGYEALKDALRREFEHSLGVAGVTTAAFDLPPATPDLSRRPQLGASVKVALDRMVRSHRKKDLRPGHLLIGILQAEVGTVPRALALAGVDRAELVERVRSELPGQ